MTKRLADEPVPYTSDNGTEEGKKRCKDVKETGVMVKGKHTNADTFGQYDVKYLDRDSLSRWLRSKGGNNELAEDMVRRLLGHAAQPRED